MKISRICEVTKMNVSSHNVMLRNLSRAMYGEELTLMTVHPCMLRQHPPLSRDVGNSVFQQLTARILRDKRLSRLPLCCRTQDGLLHVLSGNAQVDDCIRVGEKQILIVMVEKELSASDHIAFQLSLNTRPDRGEPCLQSALPPYLSPDDVPDDVARAYLLWRGIPATFIKFHDERGDCTGFSWKYDHTWRRRYPDRFEAFWCFQDASSVLWQWMSDHRAEKITSENLLHIWG